MECAGVPAGAKMLVGELKKDAKIWVEDIRQKYLTNYLPTLADTESKSAWHIFGFAVLGWIVDLPRELRLSKIA